MILITLDNIDFDHAWQYQPQYQPFFTNLQTMLLRPQSESLEQAMASALWRPWWQSSTICIFSVRWSDEKYTDEQNSIYKQTAEIEKICHQTCLHSNLDSLMTNTITDSKFKNKIGNKYKHYNNEYNVKHQNFTLNIFTLLLHTYSHVSKFIEKHSRMKVSAQQLFKFLSQLWSVFPWEFKVKRKPKFKQSSIFTPPAKQ